MNAITQANADGDPSSTIQLTANIAIATPGAIPTASKALFIDAGAFTIATTGTSLLPASSGAVLTVNGTHTGTGLTKNSEGTLVLSGANVTYTKQIVVNAGALRVENGSQVTFGTSFGGEGFDIYGSGASVTVSGAGTKMNARNAPIAIEANGALGGSTLTIEKGAEVTTTAGVSMVFAAGTTGTLNITGTGSRLNSSIGFSTARGQSFINVTDGGVLNSGLVGIGGLATFSLGGVGAVLISGAGSQWNSGVFHMHSGTASVLDGGLLNVSGVMNISAVANTTSTVLVSGTGSSLVTTGNVGLGAAGNGTLSVANGGQVSINNGAGILNIAANAAGTGRFNVGGETGQAATAPGTLNAVRVQFGAGTGVVGFNHTDANYTFGIPMAGRGQVSHDGPGTTVLTGANSYSGATTIAAGTLRAGGMATLSAASAYDVGAAGTLDLAGFSHAIASMTNAGTVSLSGAAPGTTLTVNGPWVGNGGTLRLGTTLGDSSSITDRLILDGASAIASGNTSVQVSNLGGLGALTSGSGIEVISALNGATTTAQSTKDAFALAGGHVDAGAFEYRLYAADASGAGENWYLRSTAVVVPPPTPGTLPLPAQPDTPSAAPALTVPTYRAEVPLFAALPEQLRQGNLVMLSNLHQRVGDGSAGRQAWGRLISTDRTVSQSGTVSPGSEGRLNGFQAGTDLWANPSWRTGVYVGQLDGDMSVTGFARGVANLAVGSNDLRSQYLGAYATWRNEGGFYADAVLQAGRHRYTVSPNLALASTGKGSSLLASIEVGQGFALGGGWVIEPQLQLMHQRVDLDNTRIGGALVQQDTHAGWIARAGLRLKGEMSTAAGVLQPYARLNVYTSSRGTDIARFIGPAASTDIASATGGSSTELAAGATLRITPSTSLYGELGQLWASGGSTRSKSGLNASAGVKMQW